MARPRLPIPKYEQVNVRFTNGENRELDECADKEDRSRPYLVGLFTRLGLAQYKKFGSLKKLREEIEGGK